MRVGLPSVRRALAALLLTCGLEAAAREEPPVRVAPGSLVRWPGSGATRCLRDDQEVPPMDGECLFAIDLLRPPGPVTLSREREGRFESVRLRVEPSPYPVEAITLPDDRYVKPSARDLARAERERQKMARVFSRRTPRRFSLPVSRPLADAPAGRNFGRRRVFNGEERQPHSGTDYPVPEGTPVLAAADGVVALSARHFFPGRLIVLDHGGGLFSTYMHLGKALVSPGAVVRRGNRIALSGSTGRVNGPHLHFGVRWQAARIDPELLFRAPRNLPVVGGGPASGRP